MMRFRGQSEPVEQVREGGDLADASHHEVGAVQWGPLGVPCTHLGKDNEDVVPGGAAVYDGHYYGDSPLSVI